MSEARPKLIGAVYSPKNWPYHVIIIRIGSKYYMEKDTKSIALVTGITHYEMASGSFMYSTAVSSAKALKLGKAVYRGSVTADTPKQAQELVSRWLAKRPKR